MIYKQNIFSKFYFVLVFLGLIGVNQVGFAQNAEAQLRKADSLFFKNKYLQAQQIYEQIWQKEKKASPSMLLKMAYIAEAIDDHTKCLYYLSWYYKYAPSSSALQKMDNIALVHKLKGYEYADLQVVLVFYKRYIEWFMGVFLFASLFLFSLILTLNRKQKAIPTRYALLFVLLLGAFFYLLNFTAEKPRAIIAADNTLLMQEPSAAARLVTMVNKGHRLEVLGKKDVWVKLRWNEQIVYAQESKLLFLQH